VLSYQEQGDAAKVCQVVVHAPDGVMKIGLAWTADSGYANKHLHWWLQQQTHAGGTGHKGLRVHKLQVDCC
jgi:hypothetical protein